MGGTPESDHEAFERDARELREVFRAAREADLVRLAPAIAAGDFTTVRAIGHAFRGSGATFGYPEASRLGERLEAAAESRDADAATRLARALAESLAPGP